MNASRNRSQSESTTTFTLPDIFGLTRSIMYDPRGLFRSAARRLFGSGRTDFARSHVNVTAVPSITSGISTLSDLIFRSTRTDITVGFP